SHKGNETQGVACHFHRSPAGFWPLRRAGCVLAKTSRTSLQADRKVIQNKRCGCSSVVERHVANVAVGGSTPITRFHRKWYQTVVTSINGLISQRVEAGTVSRLVTLLPLNQSQILESGSSGLCKPYANRRPLPIGPCHGKRCGSRDWCLARQKGGQFLD